MNAIKRPKTAHKNLPPKFMISLRRFNCFRKVHTGREILPLRIRSERIYFVGRNGKRERSARKKGRKRGKNTGRPVVCFVNNGVSFLIAIVIHDLREKKGS